MDFSPTDVAAAWTSLPEASYSPEVARRLPRKPRKSPGITHGAGSASPAGDNDEALIASALAVLEGRMRRPAVAFSAPEVVAQYLILRMAPLEHEVFGCLWLDAANRLIAAEELFRGTLTQTSVYPREVVKQGLRYNAASVILAHNHPSGVPEPSAADRMLTSVLKTALALIDVKVLDHIVVAGCKTVSFASRGLI